MHLDQTARSGQVRPSALLSGFPLLGIIFALFGVGVQAVPPPAGVAPLTSPAGGFAIDGNLMANLPTAGVGDWLMSTNAGSGASVLDSAGNPLDPARTFHFRDVYNATSDNTFGGGLKWTDNPGIWQWSTGKASSKTDIHNVLFHTATDSDGHTWVVIAADRASTSGDSYIDFEF